QLLRKEPALVAYYTFETRGRDPKRDMSILPNVAATGEALDGHIDGPRWTEGRLPGKFALRFWGAGYRDRVEIPEAERLHFAGSFSFAVWFESEVDAGYCGHLLAKGNEDWRLCMAPGNIEFTTGDVSRGTAASNVLVTSASFKPSDWHLAVATFQCDQRVARKRVYVDGQLLASSTGPLLVSPPHGAAATIGDNAVWASGGQFAGLIDEVAIFSRALTAGEIKEMFAAGSPSPANARGSLQPVTPSTQRETKR
ncbi:MAG: LamG domain-containing protein, partial [Thermoguttaceae bacterium]